MKLVEQHIISNKHQFFKEIDATSFLAKNLYNKANYIIRQEFILTSKQKESGEIKTAKWIRYNELQKLMQNSNDADYKSLPAKVSQQVLMSLDKNWKSFFAAIKSWKKYPEKYKGRPRLPNYKHKTNGRNVLTYTIQAISKTDLKNGIVSLSKTGISIKTKHTNINQVRIVPKIKHYIIEIIYEKKEVINENLDKNKIAGIDLGLNNLVAVTSNQNVVPLLINGRPLKSMNQYFNKKKAKLQSYAGDKKTSNRLEKLTNKRNQIVKTYLHNASRKVVNHLILNEMGTVVIGKNKQWKTEINIGKRNNQAFVNIPHARFIDMLKYKCEHAGKRKQRGLFVTKEGRLINADCNGSGNIIRKAIPTAFDGYGIEGVVAHPVRVYPYKLYA